MVLWYQTFHIQIFYYGKENSSSSLMKESLTLSGRRPLSYRNQSIDCSANQWTGFYMITASVMKELMLWFWCSHKPFHCGQYEVILYSLSVISCKLLPTWFINSLLSSFICILLHAFRQMISYKKLAIVGADLSFIALASDHFEKCQYHTYH